MRDNTDLLFAGPSIEFCPCNELKKHVQHLLSLSSPQEQLEYYNQYIDSLIYMLGEKHLYGNYSHSKGFGDVFYALGEACILKQEETDEQDKAIDNIFRSLSLKERDRIKDLLSQQTSYQEKLQCYHKSTAGEIRYDLFAVGPIDTTDYLSLNQPKPFTIGPGQEFILLDFAPSNSEEIRAYNSYTYNYVQQLIAGKAKHWLIRRTYNGFLSASALSAFEKQLERAIDQNLTITSKLKEIETKYRIGEIYNYSELIYPSEITDIFEWQSALLNALFNGDDFDLGRLVLNLELIMALTHVEQVLEFYKKLLLLKDAVRNKRYNPKQSVTNAQKRESEALYWKGTETQRIKLFQALAEKDLVDNTPENKNNFLKNQVVQWKGSARLLFYLIEKLKSSDFKLLAGFAYIKPIIRGNFLDKNGTSFSNIHQNKSGIVLNKNIKPKHSDLIDNILKTI